MRTEGVDVALTSFLGLARNRLRRRRAAAACFSLHLVHFDRSLFTKVGPGVYRYGTCSLRLRLAQGDYLEAAGENELWEPLEAGLNSVFPYDFYMNTLTLY